MSLSSHLGLELSNGGEDGGVKGVGRGEECIHLGQQFAEVLVRRVESSCSEMSQRRWKRSYRKSFQKTNGGSLFRRSLCL
jgi:hypothetical protein